MRVTGGRALVVNVTPKTNWIFVLLETDTGLTGVGEATLDGAEPAVVQAIDRTIASIVGRDPLMGMELYVIGNGGRVQAAAVSGIDQALWDMRGKAYGVPVCQLLPGAVQTAIPVYGNINRGTADRSPSGFAARAEQALREGFRAVKCAPFDGAWWWESTTMYAPVEEGIRRVDAIRKAIGPSVPLHVDCHWRFDNPMAIRVGRRLQEYDLFWYEAPVPEQNPQAVREVKEQTGMRIAGGEMQTSPSQYTGLLKAQALDVLMPDVKYIGGITGMLAAAAVAEAFGLAVGPHNPSGPVATVATLHAAAAMRNLMVVEFPFAEIDWYDELIGTELKVQDGCAALPPGTGFGIDLDLVLIGRHPYQPVTAPVLHPRLAY